MCEGVCVCEYVNLHVQNVHVPHLLLYMHVHMYTIHKIIRHVHVHIN